MQWHSATGLDVKKGLFSLHSEGYLKPIVKSNMQNTVGGSNGQSREGDSKDISKA